VRSAECGIKGKQTFFKFWNCAGFTYTALLAGIVIMGIVLGSTGKYWSAVVLRDKEEELLFRGDQFRQAIQRYYSLGGRNQYPPSIDELLKDSRTIEGKRHLRRKFKDPITGEDFVEIRDTLSKRIIGVHSSSDKEPFKQGNFPELYPEFNGVTKYSEWKFQLLPTTAPKPLAPQSPPPPRLH
jgi:type II secretory pathway pseudopilin PulG